jgi:thymidylate synthase (FAD)
MKAIKAKVEIMTPINGYEVMQHLERCGRTCYKSEGKITPGSCGSFIQNIIKSGHESVIEHFSVTVRFTVDRAIANEIVRHRLASYSQESTRYINYGNDENVCTFIIPDALKIWNNDNFRVEWGGAMVAAERSYLKMLRAGATPEQARCVLPLSLKTELVMTCNLREWRHFFKMRCSPKAHPQIREVAIPLLEMMHKELPAVFEDILMEQRAW